MASTQRKIICLTPVKDEAWILEYFLQCASTWADHIIVADQNSTDGSIDIARAFPKVTLVENPAQQFNEPERQQLLIAEARKLGEGNILIALDADEAISANFAQSSEWQRLYSLPAGTNLKFQWVNALTGLKQCWVPETHHPWGFVDDGRPHRGRKIHSPRVPIGAHEFNFDEVKVVHFQYADWARMRSKQRWYMAWERINNRAFSTVKLHRTYSHMYNTRENNIQTLDPNWLPNDPAANIGLSEEGSVFRWDGEILDMFDQYGTQRFARVPLWEVDWTEIAQKLGRKNQAKYADPRGWWQRSLQSWLRDTQDTQSPNLVRPIDYLLRALGQ